MITPYSNTISVTTLGALLLDTYSGAAAAYSLRKLSTTYTGSAIRVRIDTTGQPEYNIGFVDGELDVATLEGYCTGGLNAYVTTWYDQSGNARDATQTTAASQPQIVNNGSVILQNSKPCLDFDGSNDTLRNLNSTILLRERSFAFVGVQDIAQADVGIISFKPSGSSNDYRSPDTFVFSTTNNNVSPKRAYKVEGSTSGSYGLQKDGTGSDILAYGLYLETKTSGEGKVYQNGTLQATDTSFTEFDISNTQGYNLGSRNFTSSSISNYFNGKFQEFIYWEVNNITNRTGIQTNINTQYQIYWDGSQTSLLDSYGGSAAAYSLRALSSAYVGPLVRVRRASDNAEQDIYANYDGTLNTSSLESFCSGTNGFVKTWYDQSGNGYDATQTTAANQPQIVSSGSVILENGKPAIQNTSTTGFAITGIEYVNFDYVSIINVTKSNPFTSAFLETSINFNGNTGAIAFFRTASTYTFGTKTVTSYNLNTHSPTSDVHLLINAYINDQLSGRSTTDLYLNESLTTKTNNNDSAVSAFQNYTTYLLARAGNSFGLQGTCQEFIIYGSNQLTNQTGINTNINDFYSIY